MAKTFSKFNDLEPGQYFEWMDVVYRKIAPGRALCIGNDLILDFGLSNKVTPIDPVPRTLPYVIQYLHWALIQAHLQNEPNKKHVYIKLDLRNKTATHANEPLK